MNRPLIQIDDEIREMSDEEYQAFLERNEAFANAPTLYPDSDPA